MGHSGDKKILRIGIVQNGRMIEERLVRRRETVTVGESSRASFILPTAGILGAFPLFEMRGGVYFLKFTERARGKVSVGDAVLELATLREQGIAKKQGKYFSLSLSDESRGKICFEDLAILFQFVAPPPPASSIQMSANMRGSWWKNLEKTFVLCLLGSFLLQTCAMVYILSQDYPEPPKGLAALPDRFVTVLGIEPKALKEPIADGDKKNDEEGDQQAGEKDKPAEAPKKAPVKAPKAAAAGPAGPETAAARRERMNRTIQNNTILKFIGTTGGEGGGSLVDTLKGGAADVSMAEAFSGSSGVMVADGETGGRDRRMLTAGGSGLANVDINMKRSTGPGVGSGDKTEVSIKGKVKMSTLSESDTFGSGTLSVSEIASVTKRKQAGIQSCYERRLKQNPNLKGKVKVQITIMPSGRTSDVSVIEDTIGDSAVGVCIVNEILRWRFPKPEGGEVTVAVPFIFSPAN